MIIDFELKPFCGTNNIPIILCSDERFIDQLGVLLQSIIDNSSSDNHYDIIIFENNLTEYENSLLCQQLTGIHNFSIRYVPMAQYIKDYNAGVWYLPTEKFTVATYFRLFIPLLCRHYDKVLYLDSDMIVTIDIAELYKTKMDDYYLAACLDQSNRMAASKSFSTYLQNILGIRKLDRYFNAGVLVFNVEKMIKDGIFKRFVEVASTNRGSENGASHMDQDVLNTVCQGNTFILDHTWNVPSFISLDNPHTNLTRADRNCIIDNARVIHFGGAFKANAVPENRLSRFWWDCARKTPFYEGLLVKGGAAKSEQLLSVENEKLKKELKMLKDEVQKIKKQQNCFRWFL